MHACDDCLHRRAVALVISEVHQELTLLLFFAGAAPAGSVGTDYYSRNQYHVHGGYSKPSGPSYDSSGYGNTSYSSAQVNSQALALPNLFPFRILQSKEHSIVDGEELKAALPVLKIFLLPSEHLLSLPVGIELSRA